MDAALAALDHRGPDGSGRWRAIARDGGEIALGHTRLAVVDPNAGAQPMFSHDRRFAVSFNGEIYNHAELRESLRLRGSRFATRCDTEVLIEAYRVWGMGCLPRLRGMFAFALYDIFENRLVLGRDAFGKKPLFLAKTNGCVAFASEIAPLLSLPAVGRRLNREVLHDYLLSRYAPGPETFFHGVRKLPPGHYAIHENGALAERRWFTPPIATVSPKNVDHHYALEAFRGALRQAVEMRLRADAACGVYLSGGLDSSVVAAIAARRVNTLKTFTAGFDDARYSEASQAVRVAAKLGARHEAVTVTARDVMAAWPDAVRRRGAPVSEASDIPLLMLSRAAKDHVKVALTGEGADEVLAGYPKHRAERWTTAYSKAVSAPLHRALVDPLIRRLPYDARRLKILSRALGEADAAKRARLWFANDGPAAVDGLLPGARRERIRYEPMRSLSPLRQIMLADHAEWLPDNLLERGDRMLMAAGIEGRMPFMDVELANLAASFPSRLLFDGRGGKAILRQAAAGWLDAETINRRKMGFRTPMGDWFRGDLKPMLTDLVGGAAGVRQLLDGAVIDRLLSQHLDRRVDHTDMLWTIANLELFLREYDLDPAG